MQHSTTEPSLPKSIPSRRGRAPANKGQTYPVELLTRAEVRALLAACSRRAPTGVRNCALLATMYRCGLRVSEALALLPRDVDFEAGTVRIRRGKGGKARTCAIDAGALALIDKWLEVRRQRGISRSARLFCTLDAGPVSSTYVRAMMKRMAVRAGIAKRCHPHGLRHCHAVELIEEKVSPVIVQRQLGHASLAVTTRYLQGLRPQAVVEAIAARPAWRDDPQG